MGKCAFYPEEEDLWIWQPFGPGETIYTFVRPGYHYRGFPAIKISERAYIRLKSKLELPTFKYKGKFYRVIGDKVALEE